MERLDASVWWNSTSASLSVPFSGPPVFRATNIGDVRQLCRFIEPHEVCLYIASPHQMNSRQKPPINVEWRLNMWRIGFLKQLPLRLGKTENVVGMVLGDAAGSNCLGRTRCITCFHFA